MNWPLILSIAIPEFGGQAVGLATKDDVTVWFKAIRKPSWCPPGPIFGIAWTILYACMGYAAYLVWLQGGWEAHGLTLGLYVTQLAMNLAWPLVFFREKKLQAAQYLNLGTLAVAALATSRFYPVNQLAGKLMLPYLAWLAFANALNYSIIQKNGNMATSMVEDFRHDPSKANPGESSGRYTPPGGATACLSSGASRGIRDRWLTVQVGCSYKAAAAPQQQRVRAARARLAVRPAAVPAGRGVRVPVGF